LTVTLPKDGHRLAALQAIEREHVSFGSRDPCPFIQLDGAWSFSRDQQQRITQMLLDAATNIRGAAITGEGWLLV
jgi:hypothetical protein